MIEKTLFQKICAGAFLIFAVISCIATAQSLCLTLELQVPFWVMFVIAFVFAFGLYLLTSYCFKLVIDALNMDVYVEHRRRDFILGILGVLLFWLVCSMPTNTHSLLYTKVVDTVVVAELDNQKEVLSDESLKQNEDLINECDQEVRRLRSRVGELQSQFMSEVIHPDRPGFGDRAKGYLQQIEELLGMDRGAIMQDVTIEGQSQARRNEIAEFGRQQIENLLNLKVEDIMREYDVKISNNSQEKNKLIALISDIDRVKANMKDSSIGHQDRIKEARRVINAGYNLPDYRDLILDNVETLKNERVGHTDSNVEKYKIYKTERLHNVFKMWGDYFKGRMSDLDFDMMYWIIISIIIDIAGLVFFAIAFRKTY